MSEQFVFSVVLATKLALSGLSASKEEIFILCGFFPARYSTLILFQNLTSEMNV